MPILAHEVDGPHEIRDSSLLDTLQSPWLGSHGALSQQTRSDVHLDLRSIFCITEFWRLPSFHRSSFPRICSDTSDWITRFNATANTSNNDGKRITISGHVSSSVIAVALAQVKFGRCLWHHSYCTVLGCWGPDCQTQTKNSWHSGYPALAPPLFGSRLFGSA